MGEIIAFQKAAADIYPAPPLKSDDNTELPYLGYQEFKSLMKLNAITFYYEGCDLTTMWSLPIYRANDVKSNPGQDRPEWNLSPSDYAYWYLTHKPNCSRVQLSKDADGQDYNIRYDAEAFESVMQEARKSMRRKSFSLITASP